MNLVCHALVERADRPSLWSPLHGPTAEATQLHELGTVTLSPEATVLLNLAFDLWKDTATIGINITARLPSLHHREAVAHLFAAIGGGHVSVDAWLAWNRQARLEEAAAKHDFTAKTLETRARELREAIHGVLPAHVTVDELAALEGDEGLDNPVLEALRAELDDCVHKANTARGLAAAAREHAQSLARDKDGCAIQVVGRPEGGSCMMLLGLEVRDNEDLVEMRLATGWKAGRLTLIGFGHRARFIQASGTPSLAVELTSITVNVDQMVFRWPKEVGQKVHGATLPTRLPLRLGSVGSAPAPHELVRSLRRVDAGPTAPLAARTA